MARWTFSNRTITCAQKTTTLCFYTSLPYELTQLVEHLVYTAIRARYCLIYSNPNKVNQGVAQPGSAYFGNRRSRARITPPWFIFGSIGIAWLALKCSSDLNWTHQISIAIIATINPSYTPLTDRLSHHKAKDLLACLPCAGPSPIVPPLPQNLPATGLAVQRQHKCSDQVQLVNHDELELDVN